MHCSICGASDAPFTIEDVINGKRLHFYLCADCAATQDVAAALTGPIISLADIFSALASAGRNQPEGLSGTQCPACGLSFTAYRDGAAACVKCTDAFAVRIVPLLRKTNSGRAKNAQPAHDQDIIDGLTQEMLRAVREENYEHAAVLRDEIRKIKRH
jgi:protein arginine kinase activator